MSGEKTPTPALEFPIEQIEAIIERAKVGAISAEEYAQLKAVIQTFALLKEELQSKKTSIQRLKRMMFGPSTERTRDVLGEEPTDHRATGPVDTADTGKQEDRSGTGVKREGHGRNAAAVYIGAQKVQIPHPSLSRGDACPSCADGKVYPMKDPGVRVRFSGVAPLQAKVYECARLRCGLCGQMYTANTPEGVGEEKYDETVPVVVGLLRYGVGMPFNRIEKLQANFGIPLASSTQWGLVEPAGVTYSPVYEKMQDYAAEGTIVYNDDTTMTVLGLTPQQRAAALGEEAATKRTGVFTSGIVSIGQGHRIALFFTGVRHAGENLTQVLKRRPKNLPPPIQMCDGLDHNLPKEFETLLCRCNAHAPLDSNIVERTLKRAIQHRRNSLFYKTLNGARVGDTFMSLIHTAELNGENAFDYLVALLRHPAQIAANPAEWMPWNFRMTLQRLSAGPDPPA